MDNYEHEVDLDNGGYSLTAPVSLQATTTQSAPAGGYPAGTANSGTHTPSKMDIIRNSKERKYKTLTALKGLGPNDLLPRGITMEMEGSIESMANKVDNNYSIAELNSIIDQMYDEYGVMETDQGLMSRNSDGQLVPYEGNPLDLASLYTFATKDGLTKTGTYGGLDPRNRYSDETLQGYKTFIGPLGVDRDNLLDNKIMPHDKVRLAEALIHGNRNMLKYRAARHMVGVSEEDFQELRDLYGTGASEVYRSYDGIDDSSTDFDRKELWAAFKERFNTDGGMQLSREERIAMYDAQHRQREIANYGFVDRVANAAKGAVSMAALELLVNPADMAMELFGSDISDEEGKAKMVNDFFGYKGEFADAAMKEIEGNVSNLYYAFKNGTDVDYDDVLNILKTSALTPELLGSSIGGIFALFVGFGKFFKVGKAINNVEKQLKAGEISSTVAKAKVKEIKDGASYLEKAATLAADNVGFAAVVAGHTNDSIDAFMENNNGEWDASDLGRIVLVETLAAGIDRFSGSIVARDIPGLKGLIDARGIRVLRETLEDLDAGEYGKLLGGARKAIGAAVDLGVSSGLEGITEYGQTLGEIFNEKYATEKYGKDIAGILFSDESNIEALTGAAVGISTGGQMELMGMTSNALRSLRRGESRTSINDPSSGETGTEVESIAAVSEEQRSADREVYRNTIKNLSEALESEDFTSDSLGQMAETLQVLNSLAYSANNTTPEQRAADKAVIDRVNSLVVGMVLTSEDGAVPLSRTTVIVENSTGGEEGPSGSGLESQIESNEASQPSIQEFSDAEKRSLVEMVLSETARQYQGEIPEDVEVKLHNFAETNNVKKKTAERILKSYASVELEATVEDRGVVTRTQRLEQTLTSGTATKEDVQKQYDEAVAFYATTRASIDALEQGIQEAENRAITLNKKAWNGKKKPVTIKTKYMTDKESSSKGEPFAIVVSYGDDKRWHAHVAEAKKRMESKKRTARNLYSLMETFHTRAESYLDSDKIMNTGGYVITQAGGKPNDKVTQEQKYVADVKKALNDKPINKVIVTEGRAKHWEPTGTRSRINSAVTNTYTTRDTLYTADDVVYLHSPGTITSGKDTISELFKKSSDAVRELDAATDMGATIVLANDHKVERHRYKDGKKESSQGQKIANVLKSKGYIPYGISPIERNIFVPDNESNQQRLAERKAEAEAASKAKKEEKRLKARFQKLAVERAATPLLEDARPMEEIEADLAEARAAIAPYFEKTALDQAIRAAKEDLAAESSEETVDVTTEDTVVSEAAVLTEDETSIDDDIDMDVVNLVASENLEENLDTYEETVIRSGIDKAKEQYRKAVRENQVVEFPASEKSIEALVKEAVRQEELAGEKGKAALDAWKGAKEKRLEGSKLREAINKGLEAFGFKIVARKDKAEGNIEFGGIGKEILDNSLGTTIDTVTYNIRLKRFDDAGQKVDDYMTKFTPNAVKIGQKVTYRGKEHTVVSINKVIHNPSSYLKSTKGTALNTIPVDMLPQVFKDMAKGVEEAFKKTVVALTADEKDFSKPTGIEDRPGQYNTFDSPARNLIFDKDGNVHESTFLAMAMSIGSVLNNEKSKLIPGPKNKKVVAAMFGIQEDNVTQAHMDFARKHGAYGMSVKETLGKGVLQALGISIDRTSSVGIHHYNRLVADLGNMVLRVAEEQGLLKTNKVPSNELSTLIKGGETRIGDAEGQETTFVTIPHTSVLSETTGLRKNEPNATAGKGIAAFEEADEMMPDVTSMLKEPFFKEAPDKDYQARAVANIRNDLVESDIPADAKKMLKSSMNTKYVMNEKEVDKFFEMMDTAEGELKAKRLFGFIPIDPKDPEYAGLLYDQKVIQEYINDDIERSIEYLRKLKDQIKDGTVENAMYFGFFYSGNQRYSIDSNTINPQNDKLHRFFIQPEAHTVTYAVDRSNNTFTYEYVQDGEKKTIDSSLYVRAALAQAFGVGIDKTHTERIINLGNAFLSLTQEQVDDLRESYLNTGEMVLMINGEKETFEPDHPSHAFQALGFIHSYAGSTDSTFENSLTAEFDALTSGFANKVQQLATLEDLTAHSNRVAVLRNVLNNPDIASMEKSKTMGINDLLADENRVDSYENLAQLVLKQLGSLIRELSSDRQELFTALQELMPGGTLIGQANAAVDSALRSMFKPSFMIFNYSASVNRIVKNLGTEMITGVLEQISKADFSKTNDPKVQAALKAADALAKRLPPGEEGPMSAAQFQELLRNKALSAIFVPVTEIKVGSDGKNEPRNLVDYLSTALVKDTYGKAVDTAFKTEFKDFIRIQDATNDMFKQAYAVFNQHLLNKVEKFREDPNNTVITEDTMKGFIRDLREVFPVIAGPLTEIINNKATLAEGVHVYDTTVRSPNEIMSTGASPQSKFKDSKGERYSRKSNPLIKSMVAAANAGAVLPFHAIDGAELATMVNKFVAEYARGNESLLGVEQQHEDDPDTVGSGLLPLHDAYMGPLPFSDITSFLYNKGTYDINSKYSMMEEIYNMAKRTLDAVTNPDNPLYLDPKTLKAPESLSIWKDKDVKEEKKRATKLIEEKKAELKKAKADKAPQREIDSIEHSIRVHGESISFIGIFTRSFTAFEKLRDQVNEARKKVYTKGTKIGTMAGFRGSIYTVKSPDDKGPDEPSLEYLEEFHKDGSYKKTTPTVVKPAPVDDTKPASGAAGSPIPGTASTGPVELLENGTWFFTENDDGTVIVSVDGESHRYRFSSDGKTFNIFGSDSVKSYSTDNPPKSAQKLINTLIRYDVIKPFDAQPQTSTTPAQQAAQQETEGSQESAPVERNVYADTIANTIDQFLESASTRKGDNVSEDLKSEMIDVGVLLDLLGFSYQTGDIKQAPSEAEVATLQQRLASIYSEVVADPTALENYRAEIQGMIDSWYMAPTGITSVDGSRQERAEKSAQKYGDGNPTANLLIQLAEELGEVLEESNLANPDNATISSEIVEVQKRAFKVLRFKEDTLIKPSKKTDATAEDNKYVGLTNKQAFEKALEEKFSSDAASTPEPVTINVWHGSNENAGLSNIAERPFHYKGKDYFSVEHAYQTLKSGVFDRATYNKYKAGNQKIAGRKGTKTDGNWNLRLMEDLVLESFKQNPDAKKALLGTGDAKFSHTQDRGVWKTEFPRILESVRKTLNETPDVTPTAPTTPQQAASATTDEQAKAPFDVIHAANAALDDPRSDAVRKAWNDAHFYTDSEGNRARFRHDHFEAWYHGGGVSGDVGSQYDAHGIAKVNPLGALLNMLRNGINTSRRFDTAPLTSDTNSGAGIGTADGGAYKDGPFIVLSGRGKDIDNGIETVLVSDPVASVIPALQQEFPNIRFIPYSQAQAVLSGDKAAQSEEAVPGGDFSGNIESLNQADSRTNDNKTADVVEDLLEQCERKKD